MPVPLPVEGVAYYDICRKFSAGALLAWSSVCAVDDSRKSVKFTDGSDLVAVVDKFGEGLPSGEEFLVARILVADDHGGIAYEVCVAVPADEGVTFLWRDGERGKHSFHVDFRIGLVFGFCVQREF